MTIGEQYRRKNIKAGMSKYAKKVEKYDLSGNLLETYDSINDAAKAHNLFASAVSQCCNKNEKNPKITHIAGEFCWKFVH